MKQIFTLLAAILLSISQSFGQPFNTPFNENFTGETIPSLQTQGWSFSNVSMGSSSGGEAIQFASPATGSGSITGSAKTPGITVNEEFVNVSFKYGVISSLNGTRTINFGWRNIATSVLTPIGTVTLSAANSSANTLYTSTTNMSIPLGITIKIEFDITEQNDKNSHLVIDDVRVTSTAQAPLPIKLLSFTGNLSNNRAQLSWSVAENETGDRFEIEKSLDGRTYTTEAVVATTEKEGTENYGYSAAQEITANASFRLKIINKNNTTSYSRIIYLKKEASASQGMHLLQNPIGSSLAFTFDAAASGIATVNVYNTAGLKVYSFSTKMQKGANTIIQAVDNKLSTGNYVLEVATTTERRTIKLSK